MDGRLRRRLRRIAAHAIALVGVAGQAVLANVQRRDGEQLRGVEQVGVAADLILGVTPLSPEPVEFYRHGPAGSPSAT